MQVTDGQDFIITTFLRWNFKGDRCAESSEGDPVLPTASKRKRVRSAMSTEPKENTLIPYHAPKDHRYSITGENNFFQKNIPTLSQKNTSHRKPCTSQ